jgi:hypothetical protein
MTLLIETPDTRAPERDYILGVVLGEFLGLDWQRVPSDRTDTRISLRGHSGEIRMPDILFQTPDQDWLTSRSLPSQPLPVWDTAELGLPITLVDQYLPVIYGDPRLGLQTRGVGPDAEPATINHSQLTCHIPIDIFGSSFFMLTRYEEIVKPDRDEHDRFPAWASLAYKENFLDRPIIDEYVEVLWATLKKIGPMIDRKKRRFQIKISHDVDRPSRYQFGSIKKFFQAIAGDIIKRADISSVIRAPCSRWAKKEQLYPSDPANTFDWIMDTSERYGLTSEFFFLSGRTHIQRDADYSLEHPAIRQLMRRIYARGHRIGLHLSYNTYNQPGLISKEAKHLRYICREEHIHQQELNSRMHYLRWGPTITARGLEFAGIAHDFSLGYADRPGFRAGTCHQFPFYDCIASRELSLIISPLLLMECSLFSNKYLAFEDHNKIIDLIIKLKNTCEKVNGNFVVLWHNTELSTPMKRHIYNQTLTI